jgi:hypothetical protein
MREIRLYGSEGGGAVRSSYPYPRWNARSARVFACGFKTIVAQHGPDLIFSQLQGAKGAGGVWPDARIRQDNPQGLRPFPPLFVKGDWRPGCNRLDPEGSGVQE